MPAAVPAALVVLISLLVGVLFVLPIIVLFFFTQRYFIQGANEGGVKG